MAGFSGIGTSGFGPNSGFRFSGFRFGSLDGRNNTFRYPSPWWDVAHMELPTTVKHLFRWCRYHMLVNPLVSAVTKKMAAYPITNLVIDDEPQEGFDRNKKRWEDLLFRVLNIGRFQIEAGLDYFGYGNCVVSIKFPFYKWLQCRACGTQRRIQKLKFKKDWDFKNFDYLLTCPECGHHGPCHVHDKEYKSYKDIKLIRWNPQDLDIEYNPITCETEYAYNIPGKIRKRVLSKHRRYLETLPNVFIKAMKTARPVVLERQNLFHFKAPTPSLAANDGGWGYPPILPALKDSFYLQIMKKAQEAVMLEHLVPLDIIYPASSDSMASPYQMTNLSDWKKRIELEIIKWRWDPNYKPILPLPVGYQRIGGDGRALMLTQEIRAWSEHIIAGMSVPQEFVFGGLSYSGSSVSLRMLENQFKTYRQMHEHFLKHFLVPAICRSMNWMPVGVHLAEFKMADDMQMKQILLSLNQMKKVSDKTLLAEFDKDALEEAKMVESELRRNLDIAKLEQLHNAATQGEAQKVQVKYQLEAQEMQMQAQREQQEREQQQMGEQQQQLAQQQQSQQHEQAVQQVGGKQNVVDLAEGYARRISQYPIEQQSAVLQRLRAESPQLHSLVMQKVQTGKALTQQPLPQQKPPRRGDSPI